MLKKKISEPPYINGQHDMSWQELSEADDLASTITVDSYFGFTTHKMTQTPIIISDKIRKALKITIDNFKKDTDYEKTFKELVNKAECIKAKWISDKRFKTHVFRYLLLFDPRSGLEIKPCYRYASENHVGAAIYSTKEWEKGSRIETLVGCIAELNHKEELNFLKFKQNDFSVMYSSRKNCSQLWLGPASYVNHDCKPNCTFTINCDGNSRMSLVACTDIKPGDEIFIFYGSHFFDINNASCECFTCEILGQGYFFSPPHSTQNENNRPRLLRNRSLQNLNTIPKGSSTGIAKKINSRGYSLRNTMSRLNKIKSCILSGKIDDIYPQNATSSTSNLELIKNKVKRSLQLPLESEINYPESNISTETSPPVLVVATNNDENNLTNQSDKNSEKIFSTNMKENVNTTLITRRSLKRIGNFEEETNPDTSQNRSVLKARRKSKSINGFLQDDFKNAGIINFSVSPSLLTPGNQGFSPIFIDVPPELDKPYDNSNISIHSQNYSGTHSVVSSQVTEDPQSMLYKEDDPYSTSKYETGSDVTLPQISSMHHNTVNVCNNSTPPLLQAMTPPSSPLYYKVMERDCPPKLNLYNCRSKEFNINNKQNNNNDKPRITVILKRVRGSNRYAIK